MAEYDDTTTSDTQPQYGQNDVECMKHNIYTAQWPKFSAPDQTKYKYFQIFQAIIN